MKIKEGFQCTVIKTETGWKATDGIHTHLAARCDKAVEGLVEHLDDIALRARVRDAIATAGKKFEEENDG